MELDEFDEILGRTLDDFALTRGESKALRKFLEGHAPDGRERQVLRSRVFAIAAETVSGPRPKKIIQWLKGVINVIEGADREKTVVSEVLFSPGAGPVSRIIGLLDAARSKVDICVYTLTDDRIARSVAAANDRGVHVRLIADDEKCDDAGSDVADLEQHGVQVALDDSPDHMHHKFAIFDDRTVVTGSYNWTRSAANANQENLVVTTDPRIVTGFATEFERLWCEFSGAGPTV